MVVFVVIVVVVVVLVVVVVAAIVVVVVRANVSARLFAAFFVAAPSPLASDQDSKKILNFKSDVSLLSNLVRWQKL